MSLLPSSRSFFFPREASTYTAATLIRLTGFATPREQAGRSARPTPAERGLREGGRAGARRMYLFERSKNYRSEPASRRCLSFDRGATMRDFARYLPRLRWARHDLHSARLRSALLRSVWSCRSARAPHTPPGRLTANALTHFTRASPVSSASRLLFFPPPPSLSPAHPCASPASTRPPQSAPSLLSSLYLLCTVSGSLFAALFASVPPRVPPSGHPFPTPFAQARTSNISCRGPRSGPLPSSCRTNACNCS